MSSTEWLKYEDFSNVTPCRLVNRNRRFGGRRKIPEDLYIPVEFYMNINKDEAQHFL
jgi:hypothetical protein